jgi:hypothetical protein
MLSPTLFNKALHDINKELDENITLSLYADDITVWTAHSEVQIANANLRQAVNKIDAWTKKWGLKISQEKTECCIFTTRHSLKNVEPDIILEGARIKYNKHPKILGVTWDPKLLWNYHIVSIMDSTRKQIHRYVKSSIKQNMGSRHANTKTILFGLYKTKNFLCM